MSGDVLAADVPADIPADTRAGARDESRGAGFERTVPQELVHKTAAGEVLLTDAVRVRPGHFYLAVRTPGGHGLYGPDAAGRTDPTLFVEMLRQAAIYLSHRFYGVPLDHPFVFCGLDFDVPPPAPDDIHDDAVVLEVHCRETKERTPKRAAMSLRARLLSSGGVRATGSVTWQAVDSARYSALRTRGAGGTPPPAAGTAVTVAPPGARVMRPELVGREDELDVVVAELTSPDGATAGEEPGQDAVAGLEPGEVWALHVDQSHPVFFDHPSDHVPGMLLLEAVRQASRAALGPAPAPLYEWTMSGGGVEFDAYCELTAPTWLLVRTSPGGEAADEVTLRVDAVQNGRSVASGTARWSAAPARGASSDSGAAGVSGASGVGGVAGVSGASGVNGVAGAEETAA
ncbi:ScbA/BarX family gamma-butyrolactone biosynthesis protein [Streptomyces naganishii]|uniref:ScbA/BarX family gamma-butyrolactone biosynthesis protein n=1 Tax=Streptomyces naganishii TaxID=285447 RepID=UPI00167C4B08|nr:ScbA/BarX family gamma-butyrolactone biosynthesis protein [Streptomyces naganishii]